MKPNRLQSFHIWYERMSHETSISGKVSPHRVRPLLHGSPLLLVTGHAVQLPEDVQPEVSAGNGVPRTGPCLHDRLYHCYCLTLDRDVAGHFQHAATAVHSHLHQMVMGATWR